MASDNAAFPVYVLAKDCGEVTTYSSVQKMQEYLEAIDVENGEYEAWDVGGRLLHLTVGERKSEWLQISKINRLLSQTELAEIKRKAKPYLLPKSRLKAEG
ncbi:MAG: hypothetical protein ACRD3P_03700 [Terriglobales bacterium]